mmetsp:Transcript_1939/g.2902  ORF Transcript_1939/g.2902 Transcript_1939/m.2902 type:complete len:389 (-) Transcript_1939:108-1274(-)
MSRTHRSTRTSRTSRTSRTTGRVPRIHVPQKFLEGSQRDIRRWLELASQRKSDPERPPTATSYALANGHREMENQFDLLLKMPTEASQVPANKGSAATMKASSSRKREEFLEISKEMSRIASGVKLEQVRPESPKARSSKGKTKKPDLDPRLIGKSSAQKLIMKQLEEYRENEQARKELKSRAESHMGAKSVGQEYVRSNKKAVGRKQWQEYLSTCKKSRLSKTKHGNLVRMRKLELEQKREEEIKEMRAKLAVKMDPNCVPNRKQKRFAKNWLTILATTTRLMSAIDTIQMTDNSLDFMKLQTDEEKRNKVPAWLVRRRVNSTRNAIGSFWRCLLVQRLLDDFRGQLVSIAEEAAYRGERSESPASVLSSDHASDSERDSPLHVEDL